MLLLIAYDGSVARTAFKERRLSSHRVKIDDCPRLRQGYSGQASRRSLNAEAQGCAFKHL